MNHTSLREIAKVGVGLVMADFISVLYFSAAGIFPVSLLGITWSASAALPIAALDLGLIVLLAHYGWSMKLPIESPSERSLLRLVGMIFLVIALLHLVRIAFGWNLILGDVAVPLWLSWAGVVIPTYLSYASFHFASHKRR